MPPSEKGPSEKSPVPTYLKAMIALCVVGLVGIIAVCAVFVSMFKENFKPGHAAKIASEIVGLPDPLPAGWQYGVGLDTGYQKIVSVKNGFGGKRHVLIQFSKIFNHGHLSAKDIAAKFYMPSVAGMKFEEEGRGEVMIGGREAFYVREHCTMLGRKSAVEVAMVDLPDGSILQIQSTEDGQATFDSKLVEPLFDAIKGLGGAAGAPRPAQ